MSRKSIALLAVLFAVLLAGCPSVDHVRRLRDAQDRFSEVNESLNAATLARILPDPLELGGNTHAVDSDDETYSLATTERLETPNRAAYVEYRAISEALAELNETAAAELERDHLLSTSLTLELVSDWKAALYGSLLALEPAAVETGPGDLPTSESLAAVRTRAAGLLTRLDQAKVPVLPRDRYLLTAAPALVRYDVAYAWAVRYRQSGVLGEKIAEVVEQMARAEEGLAETAFASDARHIEPFVVLSRYVMLRSAILLLAGEPGIFTETEARERFPKLYTRRMEFLGSWRDPESPVHAAMIALDFDPADVAALMGSFYLADS
jgi:hypothetical protein